MPTDGSLGVTFVKIVGAKFMIGATVAHDVVRDFENVVTDRVVSDNSIDNTLRYAAW